MTRIRGIRNNFSGGIISKEVYGNVDIEQFNNSLEVCENMIKQATGGLAKRTGTLYLANFNDLDSDNYKLIPYPLSDTVAFVVRLKKANPEEIEQEVKERNPKGEGEEEEAWSERIAPEVAKFSAANVLAINVTAYLMEDSAQSIKRSVFIEYSEGSIAPDIDYTKIVYVQNRETLLVFIRDRIIRIDIEKSESGYTLQAVNQEYSFKPLGTAYAGNLYPMFLDNGFSNDSSLRLPIGLFMTAKSGAALIDWYCLELPCGRFDAGRLANKDNYPEVYNFGEESLTLQYFCEYLNRQQHPEEDENPNWSLRKKICELYDSNDANCKSEVEELYKILKVGTYLMLNFTSTDSGEPNLSWVIQITDCQVAEAKTAADGNEDKGRKIIVFSYVFVEEYCPTATSTGTTSVAGADLSVEVTIRQRLPQVTALEQKYPRYFNTAQPSSFRYDLLNEISDYFFTAGVYENRLYLGGTEQSPNVLVASSRTYQDWLNFSTGSLAGDGLIEHISSDYGVQIIKWLCGFTKLFVGTTDGIFVFGGSSNINDEAVTPSNAHAKLISSISAGELAPLKAMDTVFFVDSSNKKIYEIVYDEQQYAVNELSLLARELYRSGIKSHAYMQIPQKLYWACMNDGTLVSMTYLKNINSLSASEQVLGTYTGDFQVISTSEGYNFETVNNVPIKINNILSINKGDLNLVVMDVCRYLDGEVYSHTLEAFNYSLHKDPGNISRYYVDCGFELIRYATVTKITKGNTLQFTMSENYTNFKELFEKADWIGVGSTTEEENTALQKINIDNFATGNQTVSQVSDDKIAIYKGMDNGNLVSFSPDDIYINNLESGYFWLGFSKLTYRTYDDFDAYELNNCKVYLWILHTSDFRGSIQFQVSKTFYSLGSKLKVKIINSGVKNKTGESIDGIYDFEYFFGAYYPKNAIDWEKLTIDGHPRLDPDCKIALSFSDDFIVSGFENSTFSMFTISIDEVPERFYNENPVIWHPCFLTDLPEIPQINNKEIYLKYNSGSNWDIAQLKNGEYEQISIPSNLTNISVRGYCYFPYNYDELQARLDMCPHFKNTKICLLINHNYQTVTIEENGTLNEDDKNILFHKDSDTEEEYTKEYWYLAGGFSYAARIKTTPFYNMSPIVGAGLGLINYQSEVVLQMYGCQTGYIGSDFKRMSLIPYRRKPTDIVNEDFLMNPQVELVHCHTFPGKDIYQQSVCIVDINPVPLNILSITQDIEYSDQ